MAEKNNIESVSSFPVLTSPREILDVGEKNKVLLTSVLDVSDGFRNEIYFKLDEENHYFMENFRESGYFPVGMPPYCGLKKSAMSLGILNYLCNLFQQQTKVKWLLVPISNKVSDYIVMHKNVLKEDLTKEEAYELIAKQADILKKKLEILIKISGINRGETKDTSLKVLTEDQMRDPTEKYDEVFLEVEKVFIKELELFESEGITPKLVKYIAGFIPAKFFRAREMVKMSKDYDWKELQGDREFIIKIKSIIDYVIGQTALTFILGGKKHGHDLEKDYDYIAKEVRKILLEEHKDNKEHIIHRLPECGYFYPYSAHSMSDEKVLYSASEYWDEKELLDKLKKGKLLMFFSFDNANIISEMTDRRVIKDLIEQSYYIRKTINNNATSYDPKEENNDDSFSLEELREVFLIEYMNLLNDVILPFEIMDQPEAELDKDEFRAKVSLKWIEKINWKLNDIIIGNNDFFASLIELIKSGSEFNKIMKELENSIKAINDLDIEQYSKFDKVRIHLIKSMINHVITFILGDDEIAKNTKPL